MNRHDLETSILIALNFAQLHYEAAQGYATQKDLPRDERKRAVAHHERCARKKLRKVLYFLKLAVNAVNEE